jgi:hypothetical protein
MPVLTACNIDKQQAAFLSIVLRASSYIIVASKKKEVQTTKAC